MANGRGFSVVMKIENLRLPLPLSLLASVSRNDLMELDLYKDVNPPRDEMASPLLPSWISIRGPFDLILNAQPWQSYAPVIRRARQNLKISCLTS